LATWVDTNCLDLEPNGWEMTTFNEKHLIDIVWHSWEELDDHSESLSCDNFTVHMAAFDYSLTGNCRKINSEFERYFADVLDEELL